MELQKIDVAEIELNNGTVFRSFMNHAISEGDNSANRFGIRPTRNGEAVSMVGAACVGYFVRSDGITLVLDGNISNGVAYVELPEAAYAKEGIFTLAIKLTGTGFDGTMRIVDGTVVSVTTGEISDPASSVPSVEDLLEIIGRAEAAADVVNGLTITSELITGTRYSISIVKE